MAFIQHKKIKNKTYAYEVTSYWDKELKKTKKRSKYLGPVNEKTNEITAFIKKNTKQEKLILDFGDGYFLYELIRKMDLYEIFNATIFNKFVNILPLFIYRLCTQLSMYNFENWFEGNIVSFLFKNRDLSSQRISELFSYLGEESIQRAFFTAYLAHIGGSKRSVIIDATSLPNNIHIDYNEWGRSDGKIEKQFRLICVIDQLNKTPLFYRLLPGNIIDVSTLQTTILELKSMGVESSYILMDAGYFSESNLCDLFKKQINFLTRMPAGIKIYKEIILNKIAKIETLKNASILNSRSFYIKTLKIDLYGNQAYAYIVLDPERKAKETKELLQKYCNNKNERNQSKDQLELLSCGVMILASSKKIHISEVLSSYYLRQSVEQVFSFSKSDLSLLPLRNHNNKTVKGYLFFQFLLLILYLKIREKTPSGYTVEQMLLILRKLKCKVFDSEIIPSEPTKKQRLFFEKTEIVLPKFIEI